ncbi:MAG: TOBE domain-containing protein [Actinomycetota bacterium]|nr:TOBE domain-containing protein [Actinomycetota bacterium]
MKLTSVLVTHDQVEATTMADRVALMERGRLEAYDRPVVLYQEPPTQFTAGFIGELPMNFAEAECDGDGGLRSPALGMTRPARAGGLASGVPPGPYMLGFRPEDVDIAQEGGDLEGRIRVIEPMGRQVLYELLAGETVVRALGVETPLLEPDMTVNLSIRWQAAHLFHPESGERVGAKAAAQARPLDGVPGAEEAASGG